MFQLRPALFAVATLAAAAVLPNQSALAEPSAETRSIAIRLDTVSLGAGSALVRERIATAARRVCAAEGTSLREQMAARRCYVDAVQSGEAQFLALHDKARGAQPALAVAQR